MQTKKYETNGFFRQLCNPNKSLSPSYIEWEDSSFFTIVGVLKEPKVKIKYDSNFKMDIGYHIGQLQFSQDIKISNKLTPDIYNLNGTFVYQVCDPTKCIPHWDDFSIQLQVNPGEADPKYVFPIQT